MKRIKNIILVTALIFSPVICRAQQIYFPPVNTGEWQVTSPESLGWCVDKIDTLYAFLESRNTKAFLVLKDGKIVLEKYFGTFSSDSLRYWASAGKTLTGMLTGIVQEEGYLSIDSSASDYLGPGWTSCPAEKEKLIIVKDQLCMTSGLNDLVSDPDCTLPGCLQYSADAGTRWAYHNAPYTILDKVISAATGTDFNSYFNSRIRNKTGMNGIWLTIDYNHIYFSTARSMARFGLLLLAKGTWNGIPVLTDTSYFRAMTSSSQNLNKSYGYLTWLNGKESFMLPQSQFVFPGPLCPDAPGDMYLAMGKNGQLINVVPGQRLVVVRMGNAPDNQNEIENVLNNMIWQHLNAVICNSSGISKPVSTKEAFAVFPNPAVKEINIVPHDASGEFKARLYDVRGQMMVQAENMHKIDVSNISPGYYVLFIIQNGTISRYPVSVIHP